MQITIAATLLLALLASGSTNADVPQAPKANAPLVPHIEEPWWTVARDPDLGELSKPDQQPVDFSIWQAADGTWQLWSCIRGTKAPGKTRLFHSWEGATLTDSDWTPKGIAMQADSAFGETAGGLQAPYVTRHDDRYLMFYGDWEHICLAESADGKVFKRRLAAGKSGMFSEGDRNNTRDPMVTFADGTWRCYYTAYPGGHGAVYCRTSEDLVNWSHSKTVAYGGSAGTGPYSAECPFVVKQGSGYYLFRTQHYGENPQTRVYYSTDASDFGTECGKADSHLVCTLPVAAPEIIYHDGQYYIACLLPSLKGIRIARLTWAAP